jgi:NAD(P)-dependent dehydrogenase (short-subunit alcohol dehydrogenase family)
LLGLEGKKVIITGAAGGIGSELAKHFAMVDCQVVLCDLRVEPIQQLAAELGERAIPIVKDLSKIEQCKALIHDSIELMGGLDILVNCAAILKRVPIEEVDEATWNLMFDVNLKSQFFLSQQACSYMSKHGGGRVINISSQGGFSGGFASSAVYNITKGAILTMTKSFARTYAEYGINVNAIAPGFIDTEMMTLPQDQLQQLLQSVPMKRMGSPSEVASAALFLACSWSSYITGATIDVTGGQMMR